MGKPRIYGMQSGYIPNAKADMRHKPHIYQRGREFTEDGPNRGKAKLDKRVIRQAEKAKEVNH